MLKVHIGSQRNRSPVGCGPLSVIQGTVSGLQRVAEFDGGVNTATSNYHICIFNLGSQRAQLGGWSPPPIANGDVLRVAGHPCEGVFDSIACRNLTTGWTTPKPAKAWIDPLGVLVIFGAVIAALVLFLFVGWPAVLLPPAAVSLSIWMARRPSELELAWDSLMREMPAR